MFLHFQQEERFALGNKKGVSHMLMCIVKDKGLIINSADKSDMREIEKKFTRNNLEHRAASNTMRRPESKSQWYNTLSRIIIQRIH